MGALRAVQLRDAVHVMDVEQLLEQAERIWTELLREVVVGEAKIQMRAAIDLEIAKYRLPDDDLSLDEHLWLDLLVPVLQDELRLIIKEVITDEAREFVIEERSERVLKDLLAENDTIKALVKELVEESILEDKFAMEIRDGLLQEELDTTCKGVIVELLKDKNDTRIHETERDTEAVEDAAAEIFLEQALFHHLLSMLSTQGAVWDIEDFLGGPWCDQLIAQALMRHVGVVTETIEDEAELFSVARDKMTAEFGIEYLVEEMLRFGKQSP